jgi:hypothetical protein
MSRKPGLIRAGMLEDQGRPSSARAKPWILKIQEDEGNPGDQAVRRKHSGKVSGVKPRGVSKAQMGQPTGNNSCG